MNKSIKKIVALGAGLVMLGATVFGAAAADLNQYPSPLFIQDGQFNAYFVVGANAKADDVVGSIEMASSMQTAAVKKVAGSTTTEVSVPTGVQIDKTGDHLIFGNDLFDVQDTALDETDLPAILADGEYDDSEGETDNSVTYTQELILSDGNGQVIFDQDDDDMPTAGSYLSIAKQELYNYTLEFDDDVEYDNSSAANAADDIENTVISMFGNTYTITDVETTTGNEIDKLTLMAGETVMWIAQGDQVTKTVNGVEKVVSLSDVDTEATKCGVTVDGTLAWIDVGSSKAVNGVTVGVTDAVATNKEASKDVCEVNIGATEMVLEDGQEITVDDSDVDGSFVVIDGTPGAWTGLSMTYDPDEKDYLGKGESFVDPVFRAFKIGFEGMTTDSTDTYTLTASGDDATFTFTNNDGKEVELQWTLDAGNEIILATDTGVDDFMYLEGQNCTSATANDITACEGARFYVVTSGNEAHVMEINDIDTSNNQIVIKDLTYNSEKTTNNFNDETAGAETIDLPSGAGTATFTLVNNSGAAAPEVIVFTTTGSGTEAETPLNEEGITIQTVATAGVANVAILRIEDEAEDNAGGNVYTINLSYDSTDEDINIGAPVATTGSFFASGKAFDDSNDDDEWYVTNWSTTILYDQEDDDSLVITYPDEYSYGLAFVSPTAAVATTSGGVETVEMVPIQVGSAKLDTEIADATAQNLIVVGGPCANSVAATLMGNPADCAAGFVPGEAMIKLFEQTNGKVAVLVAGYSALDTRRASRVLANYKDYTGLAGASVTVKGTTLTDITVTAA